MMRKSSAIINDQVQHGSHRERNQPVQEHLQLVRLPANHALPSTGCPLIVTIILNSMSIKPQRFTSNSIGSDSE